MGFSLIIFIALFQIFNLPLPEKSENLLLEVVETTAFKRVGVAVITKYKIQVLVVVISVYFLLTVVMSKSRTSNSIAATPRLSKLTTLAIVSLKTLRPKVSEPFLEFYLQGHLIINI
jgi:hypothetical protein